MITSDEQLRAAAERLGAHVHDLQALFPARANLSQSLHESDSESSTSDLTSSFQTEAINSALDQSLFAVCERAFADSPSPKNSSPPSASSPQSPDLPNPARHPHPNSAPSASSSASTAQVTSNSRARSRRFAISLDSPSSSDEDSLSHASGAREIHRDARPSLSQTISNHDNAKKSTQQSHTPNYRSSKANRVQTPTGTPIDAILSFARGKQLSLVDVSSLDAEKALQKMRTLAIIPGCEKYQDCSLFSYLGALFKTHLIHVQNLPSHQNSLIAANIDTLNADVTDSSWRTNIANSLSITDSESYPLMLRKSMDLFEFSCRLIDKMSGAGDLLARGFLEGLYSSGTPKLVASLTTKLLSTWAKVWSKTGSFQKQSFLMERCIRLLVDFIVYELSPVSQLQNMSESPLDAFVVFNLGKEGLPVLSAVVDYCFEYVTSQQVGKDCRIALCELAQVFLVRCTCPSREGSIQGKLLADTREARLQFLDSLVSREEFWSTVVQAALQNVKKQPQLSDSFSEYTFLSSLVTLSSAKRALFDDKQEKSKAMLIDVMMRNLELLNRDLLSCFLEAERFRLLFPCIQTSIEFIHGLIASAAIQREILSADPTTKGRFLSSLVTLISNSAKLARISCRVDDAMKYAEKGPFAKILSTDHEPIETGTESEESRTGSRKRAAQVKAKDHALAREKAVAFATKVIGCLGKSVENGSWDMSQMNSIKALFHARINSSRTKHRLWNDIYKIQRGVARSIGTEELLSIPERNSFAMVVEVIRKHATSESTDSLQSFRDRADSITPQDKKPTSTTRNVDACLPPAWNVPELKDAVCRTTGHIDFDDNFDLLMFSKDALKERGQRLLALYEPDSSFTFKWTRLQKRNAYIDQARELLDKSDKTVGQRCSCVPGYPKESGNGTENRVACSNDLCENRHMKIECVPGECGAGSYCMNQRMQNLDYAKFKMKTFQGKGVGIVADEDIAEGSLVGEYQGEVVSVAEYERRAQEYEGERHFYFMTLTNKLVIDASRKSQATRFLNHSCDPNCETQKWNADGEPRVGIFAKRTISKGEEITFDYGARSLTQHSARCLCGAENCRGLLAAREKDSQTVVNSRPRVFIEEEDHLEAAKELKSLSRKRTSSREEDRRSSIVREKIEEAHSHLRNADELAKKISLHPPVRQDLQLNDEMKQKLTAWKAHLPKRAALALIADNAQPESREGVGFPRIPRRSVLQDQKHARVDEKSNAVIDEKKNIPRRLSASQETESQITTRTIRSSAASRRGLAAGRWALFEETCAGRTLGSQKPQKRKAEISITHRMSKIPRAGFLPTTSRLKKKPLRPRVVKRKRTREDDNDSMAGYSTASEAEPILEEPILSPSRLPDGNGACSDDEFTAAPPVETLHCSPHGRQQWHPPEPQRIPHDKRELSRDNHGREGEQIRGRWRPRLGASRRLTSIKSDPKQHPDIVVGNHIPLSGTYERYRPARVDLGGGAVNHGSNMSGLTDDQRRYPGYRRESSSVRETRRQPIVKSLGHRQQHADINRNCNPRVRSFRSDDLSGRIAEEAMNIKPGPEFEGIAQASHAHIAKRKRCNSDGFPTRYTKEDHQRPGNGAKDLNKPISNDPMRGTGGLRSSTSIDRNCRGSRRNEGFPGILRGNDYGTLDKAHREKTEPNQFPRVAKPHELGAKPRSAQRSSYHFGKDKGWERNANQSGRADLRHIIKWRTSNKKR